MRLGIVVGSNRRESQSERIAKTISSMIGANHPQAHVDTFLLRDLDVPLWSEDKWKADSEVSRAWRPIGDRLAACDGFVVVTPEWGGMVPPHLKNFLLMCDAGELAHKPGLIVSVSSGMGGTYPVSELRSHGFKNN